MKSVIQVPLALIAITGTWYHAATSGREGHILRLTRRGSPSASGLEPTRFNPGNVQGVRSTFETLYLALDPETALFEKRAQFGDPYGDPNALLFARRKTSTRVVPVDLNLDSIRDLSDVGTPALLDTNAQEITGDWDGYQRRGLGLAPPLGMLTAPTGVAPTQQLAWEVFHHSPIKGIITISAKVPTTRCLVVFTHTMRSPDTLRWDDPNTGRRKTYP